jgi:hydroxymethylpyrimidine pyrophosphatase-like HAD family hydrolase
MRRPDRAWFLDCDGVITDLQTKRIEDPAILDELIIRLLADEPVVFITGRSLGWVQDRIIGPLRQRARMHGLDPVKLFAQNVFVSGEKGAAMTIFSADGNFQFQYDHRLSLPTPYFTAAANVAEQFRDAMTFDSSKETMVSVEMNDGFDVAQFRTRQAEFVRALKGELSRLALDEAARVDDTAIAIDIQHPSAGKSLAAQRSLEVLRQWKIVPRMIICAGDSNSDVEMAERVMQEGIATVFHYVGDTPLRQTGVEVRNHSALGPRAMLQLLEADSARRGLSLDPGVRGVA